MSVSESESYLIFLKKAHLLIVAIRLPCIVNINPFFFSANYHCQRILIALILLACHFGVVMIHSDIRSSSGVVCLL